MCFFSNYLLNRASGLTPGTLVRGVAVGESSRLPVRKGCRPICAVLSCIVMQTTVSMGDVSRPVSRRGWARYDSALYWGASHGQPIGRCRSPVRCGRAVL